MLYLKVRIKIQLRGLRSDDRQYHHGAFFTPHSGGESHRSGVSLFALGQPAKSELAILAEGGDVGPLASVLRVDPWADRGAC
jgi:hypothetical protein